MSHEKNIFISNSVNTRCAKKKEKNMNFKGQTKTITHRLSEVITNFHRLNVKIYEIQS